MKRTIFTGLFLALLVPQVAQANPMCGERAKIVERLTSHFGETRRGMGLGSNNAIMEVFASADTGTWTITVTLPDGRMCLLASGQSYEDQMDALSLIGSEA